MKEVLRAPRYLRYVDDFALFHDDPAVLAEWRARIAAYLARRRLSLHPRKTWVAVTAEPTAILGYVLLPDGRRRLPEANVHRFRGRLRSMRDRVRAGTMTPEEAHPRVASWVAHARHAATRRLRRALLRGGPFDPASRARSARRPASGRALLRGGPFDPAAPRLSGHPAAPPDWPGSLTGP